jgi:hypothetical protein
MQIRLEAFFDNHRLRRRLRIPQVDVERLDLLDQEQDRPAGGTQLLAVGPNEARSPVPQLVDLVFVETPAQDPSRPLTALSAFGGENRTANRGDGR